MTHKEDTLQEIVSLARRNDITLADITNAFANMPQQIAQESSGVLSKLFSYLGGIFVFSGLGTFVSMYWGDMGSAARVIITLGAGFIVFIMAIVSLGSEKYARAATPLFLIAAGLQPAGIFVMLKEYGSGGDPRYGILYMAVVMLIQQVAVLWAKQRTILAFTSISFGAILFTTLFDLWGINGNLIGTVTGTSLISLAYAANNSRHAAIAPFWYLIGAATLMASMFDAVKHSYFEISYLGLTAFLIFISTYVRSRTLLLVSTLGMIWYIGYFTEEHFTHTLGWPLVLIICGVSFIGLSSIAVKLSNKYIKQKR